MRRFKCFVGHRGLLTRDKIYEINKNDEIIYDNGKQSKYLLDKGTIDFKPVLGFYLQELIEEEGENKMEDLRKLIKPCYVVVRRDKRICGVFKIEEGLKLQEKLNMGTCNLNEYKSNLTKYNCPDSTDIIEIYGLSKNGCFDISIKNRPLIWKREEKSPTQLEIESIESEQRKLADRLSKLKKEM